MVTLFRTFSLFLVVLTYIHFGTAKDPSNKKCKLIRTTVKLNVNRFQGAWFKIAGYNYRGSIDRKCGFYVNQPDSPNSFTSTKTEYDRYAEPNSTKSVLKFENEMTVNNDGSIKVKCINDPTYKITNWRLLKIDYYYWGLVHACGFQGDKYEGEIVWIIARSPNPPSWVWGKAEKAMKLFGVSSKPLHHMSQKHCNYPEYKAAVKLNRELYYKYYLHKPYVSAPPKPASPSSSTSYSSSYSPSSSYYSSSPWSSSDNSAAVAEAAPKKQNVQRPGKAAVAEPTNGVKVIVQAKPTAESKPKNTATTNVQETKTATAKNANEPKIRKQVAKLLHDTTKAANAILKELPPKGASPAKVPPVKAMPAKVALVAAAPVKAAPVKTAPVKTDAAKPTKK